MIPFRSDAWPILWYEMSLNLLMVVTRYVSDRVKGLLLCTGCQQCKPIGSHSGLSNYHYTQVTTEEKWPLIALIRLNGLHQ